MLTVITVPAWLGMVFGGVTLTLRILQFVGLEVEVQRYVRRRFFGANAVPDLESGLREVEGSDLGSRVKLLEEWSGGMGLWREYAVELRELGWQVAPAHQVRIPPPPRD